MGNEVIGTPGKLLARATNTPIPSNSGTTPDPTVSAIAVTATIDTVMAVGRTTQLSASATDAAGNAISTSFTWSSSSAPVATVDGDGTVSAVGPGAASIQASADGETGQWSVRVVDADLDGVTALLSDPFADALIESLDVDTQSAMVELAADCDEALGSGDVLAIRTCLDGAVAVEAAEAGSAPSLAILDLFFEESLRKLRLGETGAP